MTQSSPRPDVLVRDAAHVADLHQHQPRLGGDAAVEAAREVAVPAGHHGGHHPVPAGVVGPLDVLPAPPRVGDVHVLDDAVLRLHEVGMGVEAGVEERDGDARARGTRRAPRCAPGWAGWPLPASPAPASWSRRYASAAWKRRGAVAAQPRAPPASRGCWPSRGGRGRDRGSGARPRSEALRRRRQSGHSNVRRAVFAGGGALGRAHLGGHGKGAV